MNVERILQLADFIEQLAPHQFGMRNWADSPVFHSDEQPTVEVVKHNCGTCACIGGWTELVFNPPTDKFWATAGATALLGLDINSDQPQQLFTPENYDCLPDFYTQERAVRTLRRLAATGEVRWED